MRFLAASLQTTSADGALIDTQRYDGFSVDRIIFSEDASSESTTAKASDPLAVDLFERIVADFRPDVVHFFHFMRITMSPLASCRKLKIPVVMTPTDFWLLCPAVQLRDPVQGNFCSGPSRNAANCIRHFAVESVPRRMRGLTAAVPLLAYATAVSALRRLPPLPLLSLRRSVALANRPPQIRRLIGQVDHFFAPTRHMQRLLAAVSAPPEKISLTPYGIPVPSSRDRAARTRGRHRPLYLGFIGTLAEHKGAKVLLEALRKLPDADLRVNVYGSVADFPAYASELVALASADARVKMLGEFESDDIGVVLSQLDALVIPSLWHENVPLVMLEALAVGCPVIASDVSGVTDYILHGINGLLFSPGDSAALAIQIARLHDEPDLLPGLVKATTPPRSIDDYVSEIELRYQQLIQQERLPS